MEDELKKKCGFCQEEKNGLEFNKSSKGRMGLHNHCRSCQKEVKRRWYLNNRESELAKGRDPEIRRKGNERFKEKYHSNELFKRRILDINNERRREENVKVGVRKQRKRWMENPRNRIACNLRSRIRHAIKNPSAKSDSTENLLGITFEELRDYLTLQFTEGMSWDNYGEWHIDHIIPCSYFDLTLEDHQRICFHYLNLQPMWGHENISKHDSIVIDNIEEFIDKIKSKIYLMN